MCADFTDLNKCCPKDDSTTGCEMMALLDCFSGYHQIWLHKEDEEKMGFITPFGTYCYLRIPEGLRNVGPTLCRMMKVAMKDHVGRNVLSYVDDIVIASKKKDTYISDLAETFTNMHEARLKINPEKCIFKITRGIEANPDEIRAIIQMQPLQSRKDVKKLTGGIASLNQFIAKLAERNLPFFTILRGSARVDWRLERQKSFEDLKQYLKHLPTLSSQSRGSLSSYMSPPRIQQSADL
jgi:hypothetical protein